MKALRRFRIQERRKIWSRQAAEAEGMMLLTSHEYAKRYNYAVRTVRHRAQCGRLQAFKEGGNWFIPVAKL